jgi:hypothetical protein
MSATRHAGVLRVERGLLRHARRGAADAERPHRELRAGTPSRLPAWEPRPGSPADCAAMTRTAWPMPGGPSGYTVPVRSHEWIDRRSLALHEVVAAKLEGQPQLLNIARANRKRWLARSPVPALGEWRKILDSTPLPELLALLRSSSAQAPRLRQSSPFAGLLVVEERRTIMSRYEPPRPWTHSPGSHRDRRRTRVRRDRQSSSSRTVSLGG